TLLNDILAKALAKAFHGAKELPGAHKSIEGLHHLDKVITIDQSPIGRTPRSNPATYTGLFTPIRELGGSLVGFALGPWETFWILFYGFATYGNAGWLREQVCLVMCPYARFQGAMFDKDTLIISYDPARGEPRGARKRNEDHQRAGKGDCVDCTLCVQVCPTGIDIRDGLQVGCIACGACVDVCDSVMDKVNYPRGLIRYTSENVLEGRPQRLLRPRVLVY
ncbi:MAG: 4Fe-4S dicluster domain-containing protein, partial [Pseudomonadota bacterium]